MAAIDEPSMRAALEFMRTYDTGLSALRYPRDNVSSRLTNSECPAFVLGKARALVEHDAPDAAVLAYGVMGHTALDALALLGPEHRVNVYDARFAKPVDIELLRDLLTRGIPVLTIEDHGPHGGFGAAVVEAAVEAGLDARLISRLALPDAWIYQDSRKQQLAEAGLDAPSVARAIRTAIDRRSPSPVAVVEVRGANARVGAERHPSA
jgi:1-deoxy-D-xylulose-5-phosphate synthase